MSALISCHPACGRDVRYERSSGVGPHQRFGFRQLPRIPCMRDIPVRISRANSGIDVKSRILVITDLAHRPHATRRAHVANARRAG
jgi:hypothetical protein